MKQRVETGHERLHPLWDESDSEWPAAWPERLAMRSPLPANPTPSARVDLAPPTSARTVLTALDPGTSRTIPDLLERTR